MKRKELLETIMLNATSHFEMMVQEAIYCSDIIERPLLSNICIPLQNSDKSKTLWINWIYSPKEISFDDFKMKFYHMNDFNTDFKINYFMLADNIEKEKLENYDSNCTYKEVSID